MALRLFLLSALVACGSKRAPVPVAADIAIVDVTVIPMDREVRLPHQTVLVQGDRIVALGAKLAIPAGAKRIEGAGKFLIPGLADMHVHTFDSQQLALFATEGVTTIRVMWGFPATLTARDNAAGKLSPSIVTAGSIIDGDPPIWPGSTGVSTPEQAIAAVEEQKKAGYDFIKVYAKLSPEAYRAIVGAAVRLGMRVIGHVPTAVGLAGVLDAKQASIEHLDGYAWFARKADAPAVEQSFAARMGAWQVADPAKVADAIARTKAAGTWNCPTLIVTQRISHLDQPATLDRPENRLVSAADRAAWDPSKDFRFRSWKPDDFETARGSVAWQQKLVKQLSDAGAGLLAGTDVGNPWLVPGYSLHEELALLVGAGLTPYQALRAATSAPAAFLKAAQTFGTIAVDRRADLVLVDGDPLADIHNTAKISGVMLRGRWLPATELHAEQERIAALYRGEGTRFDTPQVVPKDAVFHARYQYGGAGLSGEERLAASPGKLVADVRTDGGPDQHYEVELGDGTGNRIHLTSSATDLTFAREGKKVRLTGKAGTDNVDLSEPIAADEVLGGEPVVADAIFLRRMQTLAVGKEMAIKLAVLTSWPKLSIQRMTVQIKRLPDGTRTIGKDTIAVHEFSITHPFGTSTVALDEQGWPVATMSAQRVE